MFNSLVFHAAKLLAMYYTMFKHILQSGYNQQNCLSDGGIHCKKSIK